MNAWPDRDRAVIARYLGKLRLRSTNSRTYYRQVLHGFQDVAERHPAIDRQMLEVWLQNGEHAGTHRRCCTVPASSTASLTIWSRRR